MRRCASTTPKRTAPASPPPSRGPGASATPKRATSDLSAASAVSVTASLRGPKAAPRRPVSGGAVRTKEPAPSPSWARLSSWLTRPSSSGGKHAAGEAPGGRRPEGLERNLGRDAERHVARARARAGVDGRKGKGGRKGGEGRGAKEARGGASDQCVSRQPRRKTETLRVIVTEPALDSPPSTADSTLSATDSLSTSGTPQPSPAASAKSTPATLAQEEEETPFGAITRSATWTSHAGVLMKFLEVPRSEEHGTSKDNILKETCTVDMAATSAQQTVRDGSTPFPPLQRTRTVSSDRSATSADSQALTATTVSRLCQSIASAPRLSASPSGATPVPRTYPAYRKSFPIAYTSERGPSPGDQTSPTSPDASVPPSTVSFPAYAGLCPGMGFSPNSSSTNSTSTSSDCHFGMSPRTPPCASRSSALEGFSAPPSATHGAPAPPLLDPSPTHSSLNLPGAHRQGQSRGPVPMRLLSEPRSSSKAGAMQESLRVGLGTAHPPSHPAYEAPGARGYAPQAYPRSQRKVLVINVDCMEPQQLPPGSGTPVPAGTGASPGTSWRTHPGFPRSSSLKALADWAQAGPDLVHLGPTPAVLLHGAEFDYGSLILDWQMEVAQAHTGYPGALGSLNKTMPVFPVQGRPGGRDFRRAYTVQSQRVVPDVVFRRAHTVQGSRLVPEPGMRRATAVQDPWEVPRAPPHSAPGLGRQEAVAVRSVAKGRGVKGEKSGGGPRTSGRASSVGADQRDRLEEAPLFQSKDRSGEHQRHQGREAARRIQRVGSVGPGMRGGCTKEHPSRSAHARTRSIDLGVEDVLKKECTSAATASVARTRSVDPGFKGVLKKESPLAPEPTSGSSAGEAPLESRRLRKSVTFNESVLVVVLSNDH